MALIQSIWLPRRGKKSTMAGTKKTQVLARGEFFTEYPDEGVGTGHGKAKMGDGVTDYEHLPYFLGDTENEKIAFSSNTSNTVAAALNSVTSGEKLNILIGGLKQAIVLNDANVTKLNDELFDENGKVKIGDGMTEEQNNMLKELYDRLTVNGAIGSIKPIMSFQGSLRHIINANGSYSDTFTYDVTPFKRMDVSATANNASMTITNCGAAAGSIGKSNIDISSLNTISVVTHYSYCQSCTFNWDIKLYI